MKIVCWVVFSLQTVLLAFGDWNGIFSAIQNSRPDAFSSLEKMSIFHSTQHSWGKIYTYTIPPHWHTLQQLEMQWERVRDMCKKGPTSQHKSSFHSSPTEPWCHHTYLSIYQKRKHTETVLLFLPRKTSSPLPPPPLYHQALKMQKVHKTTTQHYCIAWLYVICSKFDVDCCVVDNRAERLFPPVDMLLFTIRPTSSSWHCRWRFFLVFLWCFIRDVYIL